MWKERYKIGNELIDLQHKELFDTTDKLLRITESEDAIAKKQECANVILFLKDYAAKHFAMEEEYMLSINYSDMERHKTLHRVFVNTVHSLEQKSRDAEFSIPTVKEVAGFLTTWLVYHVAGVDQKLGKREQLTDDKIATISFYVDCFAQGVRNVLKTMVGLTAGNITYAAYPGSKDDIRVMIELVGDYNGDAVFTFSKKLTLGLIKSMTSVELTKIDEFAYSALSEITNIISGNASARISAGGRISDIKTPHFIADFDGFDDINDRSGFYLDTELGCIAISINVG